MQRKHITLIFLIVVVSPMVVYAQQGKWQRFGWNPPTVTQKDTNGGTWTYFGSGGFSDSTLMMNPINPINPYQRVSPWSQASGGFDFQFHFGLDFSLHYKNGLLQNYPLYYGPWIDPRGNVRGYSWPLPSDSTSGKKY